MKAVLTWPGPVCTTSSTDITGQPVPSDFDPSKRLGASCAWVGSRVHFRSSEDVTLLEFTSPVDREYMCRRRKFHWI